MAGVMSATALRRIEESEDSTDEELEGWSVEQRQQSAALDHTLAMLCRGRAHVTIRTVTEGFGKKADVSQKRHDRRDDLSQMGMLEGCLVFHCG